MASIFERSFLADTAERAIKSAAQGAILAIGGGAANILTIDLVTVGGAALGAALLSVLTSLASDALPFGNAGTASLTKAVEPSR